MQAIYRFGLATAFPADREEATFAELATATGLPEYHVQRFLRYAMTFHIFRESRKGVVAHTSASKLLADDPLMRQWIGMVSEEIWPAASKVRLNQLVLHCKGFRYSLQSTGSQRSDGVAGIRGAE